jgi:BirA family transcriptional regulator, biotin operon repressor / biotin---[acetyl-CoA-carboxylase] ligase
MLSLDARILKLLRGANRPLTLAEIAKVTQSVPQLIELRLQELAAAGYQFEQQPHLGCRLISAPDRLIADDLHGLLEDCPLAREILVFSETGSTSDVAAQLGRNGAAEGLIVFAEHQTSGRGRLGRKWDSMSHQGLWFSMLLRPALPPHLWTRLTTWAAVAVAEAIEELIQIPATIKWPNDVFINGKKAAGILIETFFASERFAVAGIGLNVNQEQFPDFLPNAISLRQAGGTSLDRQQAAATLIRHLDHFYWRAADDFDGILQKARVRSHLLGKWIEIQNANEKITGVAEDLNENGELILRIPDGTLRFLSGGEVTVASMRPVPYQ